MLQIIVPSIKTIEHDHSYFGHKGSSPFVHHSTVQEMHVLNNIIGLSESSRSPQSEKRKLNVTSEQRRHIEEKTRSQSSSSHWFDVRARRITASKCGRIICQQQRTDALLLDVLYSKRMNPDLLPHPIKWGIENESNARDAYITYMKENGHANLETRPIGFVIHLSQGWLGASPDAFVIDTAFIQPNGIAEFKCPFSKKDESVHNACSDQHFYCTMVDGKLHLKRDHPYYHQVQLQLYVCMDMCDWCDFCVYTLKGVAIERIFLDTEWCDKYILELESYFDAYMLPEIVFPRLKPPHIL